MDGEHFHALIERSAEGISLLDLQANILYESPSNQRIHGYTAEEMEGRNLFDFCHPDDMARVLPRFENLAKGPGVIETEIVRFRHKAGHYIYLEGTVLNATDDPRLNALVNNFRDVTARLEAERALRRAKTSAEETQRRQQQWLTNITHEFKTPLTLLRGPLAALAGDPLPPSQTKELWQLVERNIERLDGLLSDLIDLARLEAGIFDLRARQIDLSPLITRCVEDFAALARERGITIRLRAPRRCEIFAEARKLEKVMSNLLGNAVKFTRDRSTVKVSVRKVKVAETDSVEVCVTDEGPGLSEEDQAKVFDRFYQAPGNGCQNLGGTGIGLAIAREIVGLHGGEIGVTSTPGSGCTFYFRLPVGCEHLDPDEIDIGTEALPDTRSPLNAPSLRLDGTHDRKTPVPRLLLVEDSFDLRAYLRILLAPAYRVLEATNGQEAWELLQHTRPDIILSDVMMPHLDGIELCRRVKAAPLLRKVPIVLLSAKALPQHRVEGLEAGADDYLAKPFSAAELLQRLHARLRVDSMPDGNSWHDKLLECIDANLGDATFHVAKLARQVGLSPRQLHRRVLAEFGLTPVSLLTERRIQRGRVLLLAGQFETVAEVAHHVGLSPGYFSRRYRARFLDG